MLVADVGRLLVDIVFLLIYLRDRLYTGAVALSSQKPGER
jgi:hypothetical protein